MIGAVCAYMVVQSKLQTNVRKCEVYICHHLRPFVYAQVAALQVALQEEESRVQEQESRSSQLTREFMYQMDGRPLRY